MTETTYKQGNCEVQVFEIDCMTNGKHDTIIVYGMTNGNEIVAGGQLTPSQYSRLSLNGNLAENIYDWLA